MATQVRYSIPDCCLDLLLGRWPHLHREIDALRRATSPHRIRGLEREIALAAIHGNGNCPLSAGDLWRLSFCAKGRPFGGDPPSLRALRRAGRRGGETAARRMTQKQKTKRARQGARAAAEALGERGRSKRARQAARARWEQQNVASAAREGISLE